MGWAFWNPANRRGRVRRPQAFSIHALLHDMNFALLPCAWKLGVGQNFLSSHNLPMHWSNTKGGNRWDRKAFKPGTNTTSYCSTALIRTKLPWQQPSTKILSTLEVLHRWMRRASLTFTELARAFSGKPARVFRGTFLQTVIGELHVLNGTASALRGTGGGAIFSKSILNCFGSIST